MLGRLPRGHLKHPGRHCSKSRVFLQHPVPLNFRRHPGPVNGEKSNHLPNGGPDGADASLWWDMSNAHYATGVEVESKPDGAPDSSYAVIATLGVEAEFVDAGIGPAATTYRVRAFNAGGYSAYSNTVTITF